MTEEYNPVKTAPSDGSFGILGNQNFAWMGDQYGTGGPNSTLAGLPDLSNDTLTPGDLFGTDFNTGSTPGNIDANTVNFDTLSPGSLFGTQYPSNSDAGWQDWLSKLGSLSSLTSGGAAAGGTGTPAAGASSGSSNWLKDLAGALGFGGAGATGLGPYAATAGIGLYEAKQAQKDAEAKANELKAAGQPFTDQSKSLLSNFNSGTLRPDQQRLVDFTTEQGQNLIQSGGALSAIAQQAFEDYKSGKLPGADEKRLQDQVAAQKQALRDRLGTSGIIDSTLLVSQDAAIDNAAMQERQQILDQRFATGNQAYDQWLKSTTQGQQLVVAGQQFASQAFDTMLNDALGFGAAGMESVAQAIALQIQSDKELSESVSTLLGNLASAYAYTVAGPGNSSTTNVSGGAAAGGAAGGKSGGSLINNIIGGIQGIGNLVNGIGKMFGSSGSTGSSSGGPKSAGGEAAGGFGADPSGIGFVTPTQTKVPVAGESGGITLDGTLNTLGSLASIYTGIEKGGVTGYASAAGGAANLAGYDIPALKYADAVEKATQGDVGGAGYSAAIAYAGPVAALGSAIADFANKSGDIKSAGTSALVDYMTKNQGWTVANPKNQTYKMPDGRFIQVGNKARAVSEALRHGDEAAYNQALEDWLGSASTDYKTAVRGGS